MSDLPNELLKSTYLMKDEGQRSTYQLLIWCTNTHITIGFTLEVVLR